ncbi:hypothetical protein E2562_003693 [Oryza meyeriana var. granulata]|uniref:Uncharacterized protein n=1 Tax=Oryza meyeriana var. granulata TaxID=110450 RepID=A0A6G1C3J9_9ORYZ|nr:hypothetical protein E2562_003693 [Oryza meyeriana var. granulata]
MGSAVSKRKKSAEQKTEASAAVAAAAARDCWSGLQEDLLHTVMELMDVPDVVSSSAVCSAWRAAFVAFRRLRVPTPKQPPCLLYACDAYGPGAAALYSPSTAATFRVPFLDPPLPRRGVAGSAHGWLFTTDDEANPYLLNPLTGPTAPAARCRWLGARAPGEVPGAGPGEGPGTGRRHGSCPGSRARAPGEVPGAGAGRRGGRGSRALTRAGESPGREAPGTDARSRKRSRAPSTGARAALPPITTLQRVRSREMTRAGDSGVAYGVDFDLDSPTVSDSAHIQYITAKRARDWMFRWVAVSGSPSSAAGGECVVLLVHMPFSELSFARPGDARWTSLTGLPEFSFARTGNTLWTPLFSLSELQRRQKWLSVVHNHTNGLFYLLRCCGSVFSLDLTSGPSSPVARTVLHSQRRYSSGPKPPEYLAVTPRGELLQVTRRWHKSTIIAPADASNDRAHLKHGVFTTGVELAKICIDRRPTVSVSLTGLGDHALFLGHSSAVCLPTKDFPMFRPNCAYLTDDVDGDLLQLPAMRRDVGIWDFESGSLQKLGDVWPLHRWLYSPPPIWITPSLYLESRTDIYLVLACSVASSFCSSV